MKTMRRLGAAALALTMTVSGFAFTACGSDRDENTLWIGYEKQGYGSDWLNASIAAFKEENPEVKIELHEESPGYGNLVQQELQNGTPTNDLIICSAINWAPFAASGKLADLATVYASSYGNAFGDTIESAMIDGAKNTCKGSDGNYYTLRMEEAMAYNPLSQLESLGEQTPKEKK